MSESMLFLNTKHCTNPSIPYNATWYITDVRLNLLTKYSISLQTIEFNNAVYPFNAYNNKIYFDEGAGTLTATITPSSYTGSTLATELTTQLTAIGATYTVSYNSVTKKFTISITAGTFKFVSGNNNCYDELGINVNTQTFLATQSSDYPVSLSGTNYVDVISNFSHLNYASSGYGSLLCRVPVNVAFGGIVYYEPSTDDSVEDFGGNLDNLSLSLRDDKGNPFELPSNASVSYTFKVMESK
jgi:hypothetical protein